MQDPWRRRSNSTAQQREEILQAYGESRLTQKAFAAQVGISVSTLHAWRRKAASGRSPATGSAKFIPVPNLLSALPAPAGYHLHWPGGLSLEVRAGFHPEELASLLRLLPAL
jgi:hypothetical protein